MEENTIRTVDDLTSVSDGLINPETNNTKINEIEQVKVITKEEIAELKRTFKERKDIFSKDINELLIKVINQSIVNMITEKGYTMLKLNINYLSEETRKLFNKDEILVEKYKNINFSTYFDNNTLEIEVDKLINQYEEQGVRITKSFISSKNGRNTTVVYMVEILDNTSLETEKGE